MLKKHVFGGRASPSIQTQSGYPEYTHFAWVKQNNWVECAADLNTDFDERIVRSVAHPAPATIGGHARGDYEGFAGCGVVDFLDVNAAGSGLQVGTHHRVAMLNYKAAESGPQTSSYYDFVANGTAP